MYDESKANPKINGGNNLKFFKMGNHKEEQLAMLEPPDTVKNIKRVLPGVDIDTVKLNRFGEKIEQL